MKSIHLDFQSICSSWREKGFSCDIWIDPPGQSWENYVHNTDELFMVMEGEMEIEISGKISHPEIGEEVFIPRGAYHSVRNIGESRAQWLYGYN